MFQLSRGLWSVKSQVNFSEVFKLLDHKPVIKIKLGVPVTLVSSSAEPGVVALLDRARAWGSCSPQADTIHRA